jgi:hypothetical protein
VIGVLTRAEDHAIVEEFFELFKTPWEFYEHGRTYDVVVATASELPEMRARLVVIYGADIKEGDAAHGIGMCARQRGGTVSHHGDPLPIYGDLLTFAKDSAGTPFLETASGISGLTIDLGQATVRRLGFDLFREVRTLLSEGQPLEHAHIPTLDTHISMLRNWILEAGIPVVEIPPCPAGHPFLVCLTHDIDFVGIRNHLFDHTMWGFLYRGTIGAVGRWLRGRISFARLVRMWAAVLSLPLVYLKWVRDFWEPFDWYLRVEKNLPATYFIIPFKGRAGECVSGRNPERRAAAYDVGDVVDRTTALLRADCEVGVHGIDAWHNVDKGREERARVAAVTGAPADGVRVHWLLRDANTASALEAAGYTYDAGLGYNETIGYRNGTAQAFRPSGTRALLELPLHIQDGALFYPGRLDLSEPEAHRRCGRLMQNARRFGGVLTVLWHDRSHGPERFWGEFYIQLVHRLQWCGGWFGTARQVAEWFRQRRAVRFENVETERGMRTCVRARGGEIRPPLTIRVHRPSARTWSGAAPGAVPSSSLEMPWNGKAAVVLDWSSCSPDTESLNFATLCAPQ